MGGELELLSCSTGRAKGLDLGWKFGLPEGPGPVLMRGLSLEGDPYRCGCEGFGPPDGPAFPGGGAASRGLEGPCERG